MEVTQLLNCRYFLSEIPWNIVTMPETNEAENTSNKQPVTFEPFVLQLYLDFRYRKFSRNVRAAILVKTAAILVNQNRPVAIELFCSFAM